MEKDKVLQVANRAVGTVGYTIPELKISRIFNHRETKDITFGELEALSFVPGGIEIMRDCLVIKDEAAVKELLPDIEPEYFYSEEDIEKLMKNGTLDEFLDCLDFAPAGVLDLIKKIAVSMPLNDVQKRNAILEKLDFDVTKSIEIKNTKFDDGSEDDTANTTKVVRRAAAIPTAAQGPARRVVVK